MSKVILAYPGYVNFENELKIKELTVGNIPYEEFIEFDYDSKNRNPIGSNTKAVILIAHGRVVYENAMNRVVRLCEKHKIPLYIPCVHSVFPSETFHWTIKRVSNFHLNAVSLEQMNDEDIEAITERKLIPCMTLPM